MRAIFALGENEYFVVKPEDVKEVPDEMFASSHCR